MSKDDKQRVLATNRLLEILRAERDTEESEEVSQSAIDTDLTQEDDTEELQYVSQSDSDDTSEQIESSDVGLSSLFTDEQPELDESLESSDTFEDEHPVDELFTEVKTEELKEVESPESVDQDQKGLTDEPEIATSEDSDPDVAKLAASMGIDSKSETEPSSTELMDDLLLKTELPKADFSENLGSLVTPPDFNESLITYFEDTKEEPGWKSRLKYYKRFFRDNRRKLSFYIDGNTIYYLQTLARIKDTKIEKIKSYSLPYEYGNHVITSINDLLSHVLENEIDEKDKRSSFGAYFSMSSPSKTIAIKSPKLKPKELQELVEWNANKNLPFSTENKSVNYKIIKSGLEGETQEVIIGVTETDSVLAVDGTFKRNNLKLNYTSTLPILLWKSFVKNYPERNVGSYVIIHIGEARTLVIVITDHILQFTRKIALGAQDFYKAIQKKVETNEAGEKLDNTTIKALLRSYGYPQNITGLTYDSNIDLNKVTIAVRPVVERIVSELSRTLNYFKNQKSDLEWKQLLFDGVASSFPGLLESVQESIFQRVELMNPMRTGEYVLSEEYDIDLPDYPNYVLNFAMASDEAEEFNVATKNIRDNYNYGYKSKITGTILAMMIPLFIFSSMYNNVKLGQEKKAIESRKSELQKLANDTKDYGRFMGDINIVNSTNHFLNNDRTYSKNQVNMLKLFSTVVPDEIKLTTLNFVNATGLPDSVVTDVNFREHLEIAGFVNEDKSVADIYLTDFILELGKLKHFSDVVVLEKTDNDFRANSELFFKIRLDLSQ